MRESYRVIWTPEELEADQIVVTALVNSPECVRRIIEKSIKANMSFEVHHYPTGKFPPGGSGDYSKLPDGSLAIEGERGTCSGFLATLFPGGYHLLLRAFTPQ